MPRARFIVSALLASSVLLAPTAGLTQISTRGAVTIEQPASASVIQDVITQANITVTVVGTPASGVSVGVPAAVNTVSAAGQNIQLTTTTALAFSSGLVLSQDAVSVSIGAIADPQAVTAAPGTYDGVIVVIAQYN
jgi:predicted small secreted protein